MIGIVHVGMIFAGAEQEHPRRRPLAEASEILGPAHRQMILVMRDLAPLCGVAGHADEMTQSGREDGVALVDDVLRIAPDGAR